MLVLDNYSHTNYNTYNIVQEIFIYRRHKGTHCDEMRLEEMDLKYDGVS
jgi:hypothetical protein